MTDDYQSKLDDALRKILSSTSSKKLIVAGPGTGKTTLFEKILKGHGGDRDRQLVMTFLNNLKDELESKLSDQAIVFTFHGYCHSLLRRKEQLREGLTAKFKYFPGLASIVKSDWEILHGDEAPKFVGFMRDLQNGAETDFYLQRSNYYDAVEFDDSVFRVHKVIAANPELVDTYDLLLVDEFQDFNRLEASFIELLSTKSSITIVGDDDQALYSQLRGASHEFIRALHGRAEYEKFELPFCMRCPKVVVDTISDIVEKASKEKRLQGRIGKPYFYFPPRKEADSKMYPKVKVVGISAQQLKTNYMGRYVAQEIGRIPLEEIAESRKDGYPTVLVIGPVQYLHQVAEFLRSQGFRLDIREESGSSRIERVSGLLLLRSNIEDNLGWRIILEMEKPAFRREIVRKFIQQRTPIHEILPAEYRQKIADEAKALEIHQAAAAKTEAEDQSKPIIKLTSFEGSKGLSAQHVFILGLQDKELPRDTASPTDLEVCKLLVALTRTRKQCQIMYTWRFGGKSKRPSVFLEWINQGRKEFVTVNKDYWK